MPIVQRLLLTVPQFLLAIIIIGGSVVCSVAGLLLVRRFTSYKTLKEHHDVADPILGALAAIYAVLIAFIVVAVWQSFDKSNANVQAEANYVADLYQDSEALSVEFRQYIGGLLNDYCQLVIDREWKEMSYGRMSPEVDTVIRKMWSAYAAYRPQNTSEQSFFDESVRKLNSLREMRMQRLMDSRTGINPLLWLILILGAFAVITFTFLFGTQNFKAQIIMTVLFSGTIALILFTIMELDFPFTGAISISPEPFQQVLLKQI